MTLIEQPYRHWLGEHQGIWARRRVIAQTTLEAWLAAPWIKRTVFGCWTACLGMVALLFILSQFVDSKSALAEWLGQENPSTLLLIGMLEGWLKQDPELVAGVPWALLFGFYSFALFWPTLLVLTMAIPRVISRDLATRAIVIYQAKAVSKWDYLMGKAGALLGLMALTWLGPLVVAWFASNLMAPTWTFFWHTRGALGSLLVFVGFSIVFLTILALGLSSVSAKEKAVTTTWLCVWLLGWGLEGLGSVDSHNEGAGWLRHLSFRYNLSQVQRRAFDPTEKLQRLREFKSPDGTRPLSEGLMPFTRIQDLEGYEIERHVRRRLRSPREAMPHDHGDEPGEAAAAQQRREREEQALQNQVRAEVSRLRASRWNGALTGLVMMAGVSALIVWVRFRKS